MALNVVNLGFQPSILPSSPSSFVSPKPLKDRFVPGCSRVEQISFTESENSLIEALLGIQGRGRSSSPQQLNVALSSTFLHFLSQFTVHHSFFSLFIFCSIRLLSVLFKSSNVWEVYPIRFVFNSSILQYFFLFIIFCSVNICKQTLCYRVFLR